MLICLPQSLCSWDYRVEQSAFSLTGLTFDFFTEQGDITYDSTDYRVRKHGPLSGHWTLEAGDRVIADARKPNAFFRTFEVTADNRTFTVEAQSALGRSFNILEGETIIGTIRPAHMFTRRATIDCGSNVPELVQLFCFWLAVLTWKRAAQQQSSSSSS